MLCCMCSIAAHSMAQEKCENEIAAIKKVGELRAALTCLDNRITGNSNRGKQELAERLERLYVERTHTKSIELKPPTKDWTPIADVENADVCFISRLPQGETCYLAHGKAGWSYFVDASATDEESKCYATCVWINLIGVAEESE